MDYLHIFLVLVSEIPGLCLGFGFRSPEQLNRLSDLPGICLFFHSSQSLFLEPFQRLLSFIVFNYLTVGYTVCF
ncbi:Uncharacterized protein APZ42_012491 [Daphnia magna]|uniref:Uncharacterized protein n=1 Tax=Daphnia magna TaxID=35525 RepID=A0A162RV64_9CRUS|nr:Uncharacterized protein APZ42_012491 [Daphnia magna]